eukprot:1176198-Prorocentrum_minimum.AAC.6
MASRGAFRICVVLLLAGLQVKLGFARSPGCSGEIRGLYAKFSAMLVRSVLWQSIMGRFAGALPSPFPPPRFRTQARKRCNLTRYNKSP